MTGAALPPEARPVLIGVIVSAHGVRGQVRIKAFTEDPMALTAYGDPFDEAHRVYRLRISGQPKGDVVIAAIDGVSDRNAAEALKRTRLYVSRAALPALDEEEDEYYHADLIGLSVVDGTGTEIGRVKAVFDFGAGDLLEISPAAGGAPILVPFTREAVPEVDVAAGRLRADAGAIAAANAEGGATRSGDAGTGDDDTL